MKKRSLSFILKLQQRTSDHSNKLRYFQEGLTSSLKDVNHMFITAPSTFILNYNVTPAILVLPFHLSSIMSHCNCYCKLWKKNTIIAFSQFPSLFSVTPERKHSASHIFSSWSSWSSEDPGQTRSWHQRTVSGKPLHSADAVKTTISHSCTCCVTHTIIRARRRFVKCIESILWLLFLFCH